jgi:hypothetical protein
VAGGSQKKHNRWQNRCQQHGDSKTLREYKALTPGLEKELFTVGTTSNAADFEELSKKLVRYAGVNFKQGAAVAEKAVEDMGGPSFIDPPDPITAASPVEIKKWRIKYNELHGKKKAWKHAGLEHTNYYSSIDTQIWNKSLLHQKNTIK